MLNSPTMKRIVPSVLLPIFLIACSPSNQAQTNPAPIARTASTTAPLPAAQLPDFTTLVEREGPAVVNISTTQTVHNHPVMPQVPGLSPNDPLYDFFKRFMPPQQSGPSEFHTQSLGSGFIVSPDGYILTNAHVIDDADEVMVKLTDKRQFKAKVIGSDRRSDVAVIKINAKNLPTVLMGDSSKLKVGEWVVAIGAPFGFDNSVTAGIVSAKGRSLPDENYVPFIQTDVPINPGNSGGPLFNLRGQVVGINSQIYSRTGGYMGLSFAIPIDVAMNVANQLRAHGKVSRGRLGVEIQELTPELAASFGLSNANGVLVAAVDKNGPASKAGVLPGDVILKYDGKPVQNSNELPLLVAGTAPGTKVDIQVWRKGARKDLGVVVGELSADTVAQHAPAGRKANRLGMVLRELTNAEREQLNVDHGLLVESSEGAAAQAGIRRGDVILAINYSEVNSIEQFRKLIGQSTAKTVALLVQRGGSQIYVSVPLK